MRVKPKRAHDLTAEQVESCLRHLSGPPELDTAFHSDQECLVVWRRHRHLLMREWALLIAAGRVAPGSIPWGQALEKGWTFEQWLEHTHRCREAKED